MKISKPAFLLLLALLLSGSACAWKPFTAIYLAEKVSENPEFLSGSIAPDLLVSVPAVGYSYKPLEELNISAMNRDELLHSAYAVYVVNSTGCADTFVRGYSHRLRFDQYEYAYVKPKARQLDGVYGILYGNIDNVSVEVIGIAVDIWLYRKDAGLADVYVNSAADMDKHPLAGLFSAVNLPSRVSDFQQNALIYSSIHKFGLYAFYLNRKFSLKLSSEEWSRILDYSTELVSEDFENYATNITSESARALGTWPGQAGGVKEASGGRYTLGDTGKNYIALVTRFIGDTGKNYVTILVTLVRNHLELLISLYLKKAIILAAAAAAIVIAARRYGKRIKQGLKSAARTFLSFDPEAKLVFVFIAYMHFEGFLKLLFNYHPMIHCFKYVFAGVFIAIWLFRTRKTVRTPLVRCILLYLAAVLVQFFNPLMLPGNGPLLSVVGFFWQIGFFPLFFIAQRVFRDRHMIENLFKFIIILTTISAVAAHLQFMYGHYYINIFGREMADRVRNAAVHGPIAFDISAPIYWYVLAMVFCVYFLMSPVKEPFYRRVYAILFLNASAALFLAGYRWGLATAVLALFLLALMKARQLLRGVGAKAVMSLSAAVILISAAGFTLLDAHNQQRYFELMNPLKAYVDQRGFTWDNILHILELFPMGAGLRGGGKIGTEPFGVRDFQPSYIWTGDNYISRVALETGILGVLALLLLYLRVILAGIRNHFSIKSPHAHTINAVAFSLAAAFMPSVGFFENPTSFMFWILLGLLASVSQEKDSSLIPEKLFQLFARNGGRRHAEGAAFDFWNTLKTKLPLSLLCTITGAGLFCFLESASKDWILVFMFLSALLSFFSGRLMLLLTPPLVFTMVIFGEKTHASFNYPYVLAFVSAVSFGWALKQLFKRRTHLKNTFILYGALAFFLIAAAMLPWDYIQSDPVALRHVLTSGPLSPLFGMRRLAEVVSCALLMLAASNEFDRRDIKLLVSSVLAAAVVLLAGSYTLLSLDYGKFLPYAGTGIRGVEDVVRFSGFDMNPNHYSATLALLVPFFMSVFLLASGWRSVVGVLVGVFLLFFISFTSSRAPIFGLSCVLVLMGLSKGSKIIGYVKRLADWRIFWILPVLAVLAALLLSLSPLSIVLARLDQSSVERELSDLDPAARVPMYSFALQGIVERPVLGHGLGSFRDYYPFGRSIWLSSGHKYGSYFMEARYILQRNTHLHNMYLDAAYETGLLGLAVFLFPIAVALRMIIAAGRNSKESTEKAVLEGFFWSAACVLIISLLDYPMFAVETSALFYFMLGAGLALCNGGEGVK